MSVINIDTHYYIELFGSDDGDVEDRAMDFLHKIHGKVRRATSAVYNGFFNHISLIFMHAGCAGIHETNGTTGS